MVFVYDYFSRISVFWMRPPMCQWESITREKTQRSVLLWHKSMPNILSHLLLFFRRSHKRGHNGILLLLKWTRNTFFLELQNVNLWLWDEASLFLFLFKKKKSYWQISWIIPAAPEAGSDSFSWAHVVLISSRRKATLVPVRKRFLVCNKFDNLKNTKTFWFSFIQWLLFLFLSFSLRWKWEDVCVSLLHQILRGEKNRNKHNVSHLLWKFLKNS